MNAHDDPRLTAYSFGELDDASRDEVERFLDADPAARSTVESLRAEADALRTGVALEGAAGLHPAQRATIVLQARRAAPTTVTPGGTALRGAAVLATAAAVVTLAVILPGTGGGGHGFSNSSAPMSGYAADPTGAAHEVQRLEFDGDVPINQNVTSGSLRDRPRARGFLMWNGDADNSQGVGAPGTGGNVSRDDTFFGTPANSQGIPPAVRPFESGTGGGGGGAGGGIRLLGGFEDITAAGDIRILGTIDSSGGRGGDTREAYSVVRDIGFATARDAQKSTFAVDVDTAGYAIVRRMLNEGRMPPPAAVRVEELVNYFPYAYEGPAGKEPFAVRLEVAACPWNLAHRLVRVALQGREIAKRLRPKMNLVFLIDVSGSMDSADKLPLVQSSMRMLLEELTEWDSVGIVTYAGEAGVRLPPTSCRDKAAIRAAIDGLAAGGSTDGASGIALAYEAAGKAFLPGEVNRVILATDGDFNVGVTSHAELLKLIEEKAKSKIFLTVLGYGMGNLKDDTLELLADKGNGSYAYVDTEKEARRVLVEQAGATLVTIAKDVKVQVEFNPAKVGSWRLLGYENRLMPSQDFRNDAKDAGEIGAGHAVTAFYEIVPAGKETPSEKPLKYGPRPERAASDSPDLLTVSLRWKAPEADTAEEIEVPLVDAGLPYEKASPDFKFAAAVAAFALILRESPFKGTATLEGVKELASEGLASDPGGWRAEFVTLVDRARALR